MLKKTLANAAYSRLGEANRWRVQQVVHLARRLRHRRPQRYTCNICGFGGFFDPVGWPPRPDGRCPSCRSLERHRLFKLWFDEFGTSLASARFLHFAPEPSITHFVQPHAREYLTADIAKGRADLVRNIEQLEDPPASFDAIICFHVLEHVDDRKALSELYRILRPGGILLLMFPIVEAWAATYENPSVSAPHDRYLHFGQENHVRMFGADARRRISASGFKLSEFTADPEHVLRHSLLRGEKLFLATRS